MQKITQNTNNEFKQNYRVNNANPARLNALLAVILYALFSLLDAYLVHSFSHDMITTRLMFSSIMLVVVALSYIKPFKNQWHVFIIIAVVFAAIGIMSLSANFSNPVKTLYLQGGLLLLIFYCYTISKLLLTSALIAGMTITILYTLNYSYDADTPHQIFVISIVLQLITQLFGIINALSKQKNIVYY